MLHESIAVNRAEIIRRCRTKVATRSIPPPTEAEIDHGVPVFLDQLRDAPPRRTHESGDREERRDSRMDTTSGARDSPSRKWCTTMATSVRPLPNSLWN